MADPDHALRLAANEAARRLSHKEMQGAAALTLTTAPPVPGKAPPSDDRLDSGSPTIRYAYRAGDIDQPDNRALRAACAEQVPLVYFRGMAPGQYMVLQPVFATNDDPVARTVTLEPALPCGAL